MAKTEMIRARVEPALKHQVEEVLGELGLSATEAITLFYRQVVMQQGLPFEVRIPNADTADALRQAQSESNIVEYSTLEELKAMA